MPKRAKGGIWSMSDEAYKSKSTRTVLALRFNCGAKRRIISTQKSHLDCRLYNLSEWVQLRRFAPHSFQSEKSFSLLHRQKHCSKGKLSTWLRPGHNDTPDHIRLSSAQEERCNLWLALATCIVSSDKVGSWLHVVKIIWVTANLFHRKHINSAMLTTFVYCC